ncbi:MAG: NAD-dependent epimerase/dehydratase family protein [Elusimicrobia bacterium]|nr:NAD-dependent epimerase/dehydratase family protein [Elusimicrobiota bacterium]
MSALAGATVLVAGGYGFVAAGLVEELLGRGASVVALGRDPAKARERFGAGERRNFRFVAADASEPGAYAGPVDYLVHAASAASPVRYAKDPVGVLSPNVFGTRALLDLAKERGAKGFLFLSSAEVYGSVPEARQPIKETEAGAVDPLASRSCYAESKRMGETLCAAYERQHGLPAVIARLFHTYGPGMALDDGRVFADFVADAVAKRAVTIKGDGLDRRSFCFLSDAVDGLLTLLTEGTPGEAYNLANETAELSVRELADLMARLFPGRVKGVVRAVPSEGYVPSPVRRCLPDVSKLRALGWSPKVGPEEGFRRTVESYL